MIRYKRAATNDSEESANIADGSDDSSPTDQESGTSSGKKQVANISGHLDPRQRRIYLALFGASIVSSLTGLALVLAWMFQFRPKAGLGVSDAAQLANLHPVLMYSFMVSLNMYAVLVYRTHFSQPKQRLKWTHAILSGATSVMSLLGVFAMLKSHWMAGQANFYSLHSWIGSATNGLYLMQLAFGLLAFLKPGLAQHRRAALMPYHRFFGSAILVLAGVAAVTGMAEMVIFQDDKNTRPYSNFQPITFIANFAGMSVILTTAISIYLLSSPQYLRPKSLDEEPLRR